MAQSVVLTTSGASFMSTAGTMFPAIPIRYFLPVYDWRTDPYVLPTSGVTQTSAADTTSAVGLGSFGDIIYNVDTLSLSAYTISNNEFLIYDSNQTGTSTISNNRFNDTSNITLLNGRPLSNVVSATSIVYSYPNWTVNGYTLVTGNNSVPTGYASSRDKYFRVNSFAPISSAAGGQSAGLFKILLDNQKGNFKFNKILLYAARILSGGIEDTSVDPVLVGIAYLNSPVIKSNDGTNLNFFEADIEIQFSANNYFGNVSYLNNNNWNYVGGEQMVWFDGKVAIGTSAIPGSWLARAKLHISESNSSIPMTRITNDNDDSYVDTFLAESVYQNTETHKSSKPVFLTYFETSGSSTYSRAYLSLNAVSTGRDLSLSFIDPLSGAINSGWFTSYDGTIEKSFFKFDSNPLATFRSVNNTWGTLVLGLDSNNMFEHRNKMLTVHGGTLLVGSSLVSGSLSGNSSIKSYSYESVGDSTVGGYLYVATGLLVNGSNQLSTLDRLRVNTSADFQGPITYTSTLSGSGVLSTRYLLVSQEITSVGLISTDNGFYAIGNNQISYFDKFRISTSADFRGPVSMNAKLTTTNSISAGGSVSAYAGFYELDRGTPIGYWKQWSGATTITSYPGSLTSTLSYISYMLIGKTMYIMFDVQVSFSSAITYVYFTLPEGRTSSYINSTLGNTLGYNGICNFNCNSDVRKIGQVSNPPGNDKIILTNQDISSMTATGVYHGWRGMAVIPVD